MISGFDHRELGTPETAWLGSQRLPAHRCWRCWPGRTRLVLAAHPDDETLGAGGLIAASAANGARVEVIIATDGAASHPTRPTHTGPTSAAAPEEATEAVARLDPQATLTFLGLPDGALRHCQRALEQALRRRAAARLPGGDALAWRPASRSRGLRLRRPHRAAAPRRRLHALAVPDLGLALADPPPTS